MKCLVFDNQQSWNEMRCLVFDNQQSQVETRCPVLDNQQSWNVMMYLVRNKRTCGVWQLIQWRREGLA